MRAVGLRDVARHVADALPVTHHEERLGLRTSVGGGPGRPSPFVEGSRTQVIGIASGKGGVGKSSITANLAMALAGRGHSVALLDADVYGYSIPRMMGVQRPAVMMDDLIIPVESHGVRIMSIGFLTEEDSPVIWRGPMLHKALTSFVTDTFWDDPERSRIWRQQMFPARREVVRLAFESVAASGGPAIPEVTIHALADSFSRRREERYQPFPGAIETLEALRDHGVRLALLTNGSGPTQRAKLARFGLEAHFHHIQIEGEHGFGKPEERAYRHALAQLGVAARDAWMVGDNLDWEVAAPQRIDCQCDRVGHQTSNSVTSGTWSDGRVQLRQGSWTVCATARLATSGLAHM